MCYNALRTPRTAAQTPFPRQGERRTKVSSIVSSSPAFTSSGKYGRILSQPRPRVNPQPFRRARKRRPATRRTSPDIRAAPFAQRFPARMTMPNPAKLIPAIRAPQAFSHRRRRGLGDRRDQRRLLRNHHKRSPFPTQIARHPRPTIFPFLTLGHTRILTHPNTPCNTSQKADTLVQHQFPRFSKDKGIRGVRRG